MLRINEMPKAEKAIRGGIMRRVICATATLVIAAVALGWVGQKSAEDEAVRMVVQHYLNGLKRNDVESLKKAFWPDAKLFFVKKDGQLGQLTQSEWYKSFAASAGKEEEGELRITVVDITGNAASVKVEEDYPGSKYIDYLSLLKFNGEWKIVNKIYTSERKQK
jgi:putative lumazine-binding protein